MNAHNSIVMIAIVASLALSCTKDEDSDAAATTTTSGSGESASVGTLALVPSLALASPTGKSEEATALTESLEDKLDSPDPKQAVEALDAVFESATDIKGCLVGLGRNEPGVPSPQCYGPSVVTQNHPDWRTTNANDPTDQLNAFLPSGDLGIYSAEEAGGQACIAAKMNSLTDGIRSRAKEAIETGKRVLCFARVLGKALPAVGETVDFTADVNAALEAVEKDFPKAAKLTFTTVKIAQPEGDVYQTDIEATVPMGTLWTRVVTEKLGDDASNGYVWGVFDRSNNAVALQDNPAGPPLGQGGQTNTVVNVFSVIFAIDGDSVRYDATKSLAQSVGDLAKIKEDKTSLFDADKRVRVATEGNPGYDHAIAHMDKSNGTGEMVYMWTAGSSMEEQRTMHAKTEVGTDGKTTGWGYFGFGPKLGEFRTKVKEGTVAATQQSVEKMICNWAGPSNSHAGIAYAQKQEFALDDGRFVPTVNNIGFAAQNSCGQTGYTANFKVAKGNSASDSGLTYAAWPTFSLQAIDDATKADLSAIAGLLVEAQH